MAQEKLNITKSSATRRGALALAATLAGLIAATAVVGYFNFGLVFAAMRPIGPSGFLALIVAQLALAAPLGLAWWLVTAVQPPRRIGALVWASLVAEAVANVLPFSQLGGAAAATRAAVLGGIPGPEALASNLVDITVEIAAQLIFTLVGLILLARHLGGHDASLMASLAGGLAVAAAALIGFILLQRRGSGLVAALASQLVTPLGHGLAAVTSTVESAYRRPLRLLAGLGVHLAAWVATAAVTGLILSQIGHPLPFLSLVALESLLFAIRNAAFVAPAGLGVQEGAYVLLGPLFGLPPEAALALSLLKRARDIAIGVPVLLSWQLVEIRRARSGRRVRVGSAPPIDLD